MKALNLSASVELQASGDQRQPTVKILAYGGGVIVPGSWGSLVIDVTGITAAEQIPLLADHSATTDGVAGHGKPVMAGGKITVDGVLIRGTEAADKVLALAAGGFKLQASVGVHPTATKRLQAGESATVNGKKVTAGANGLTIVTAGVLQEVSILPLGADSGTSVSIAAQRNKMMSTDIQTNEQDILTAERERVGQIAKIAAAHPAILEAAIGEGWDPQRTELEVLRASRPVAPAIVTGRGYASGAAEAQKVLAAGLLCKLGRDELAAKTFGEQAVDMSRRCEASTSLVDLCRASLKLSYRDVPSDRNSMIRAAFSTTSLPSSISDGMHAFVREQYRETPATWRSFAAIRNVGDFRDHTAIMTTHAGEFQQVSATGEVKHGSLSASTITFSADTFAKQFKVSRRDVINDHVGALADVGNVFARQSARKVADAFYEKLLSNTGSHFHTDNANYASGGGSALSITSLGTAVKAMRLQTDGDDNNLDIMPKTLVVPPELEITARALLESIELARTGSDSLPTGNPFRGSLALEVEPRLSNTAKFSTASTTGWYVFGAPADLPMIACFLDGVESPVVEFFNLDSDIDHLGVAWRAYIDFGNAFGDPKAGYLSAGA